MAAVSQSEILWIALIPLLPLVASLVIALINPKSKGLGVSIAMIAMLGSLVLSFKAFYMTWHLDGALFFNFEWLRARSQSVELGVLLNSLTGSMLAMVTFVGLLIFIFAGSYMDHDERKTRFFCYLCLFASGMLGLLIANSILLLFMCWEIVGLASYLLIGFWFHKPEAAKAAQKAFIATRVGDIGFLIGILLVFKYTGTFVFYSSNGLGILQDIGLTMLTSHTNVILGLNAAGLVALLFFVGAIGKSGQLPLHIWLPDAMEGPTPVSALIHAATMVAAGVFLVARTYPLFAADPITLSVVAWFGAATALFAAIIALAQYDIKRILAFSTVSQLGLMMVGLGTGGVATGMFHLLTHAFFKALLFLGAGSIIHGCHDEQDIRKMGGLLKYMPTSSVCYLFGTLALCAFPFTAGFFSKDAILLTAWSKSQPIFWISASASFLTAVYMTRQCVYVFLGKYRGRKSPHESSLQMTVPLMILAVISLVGGYVATSFHVNHYLDGSDHAEHLQIVVIISYCISLGGIFLGYVFYKRGKLGEGLPDPLELLIGPIYRVMENRFYVDEVYNGTIYKVWDGLGCFAQLIDEILNLKKLITVGIVRFFAKFFAETTDEKFINGLAFDGVCHVVQESAPIATRMQNGFFSGYLRTVSIGVLLLGIIMWVSFGS